MEIPLVRNKRKIASIHCNTVDWLLCLSLSHNVEIPHIQAWRELDDGVNKGFHVREIFRANVQCRDNFHDV